MLACHFQLLNFRFPVLRNTLHKLSADNVVLTSFLLIGLPPLLTECISLFQKKTSHHQVKKKKASKRISFKFLGPYTHPLSHGPVVQCLPLSQCDGTTILQLSQYCTFQIYSIGTMITEKGQFSLIIYLNMSSHIRSTHILLTHRWPCYDLKYISTCTHTQMSVLKQVAYSNLIYYPWEVLL